MEGAGAINMRIDSLEALLNLKEDKEVVARLNEKKADWDMLKRHMSDTDHKFQHFGAEIERHDRTM